MFLIFCNVDLLTSWLWMAKCHRFCSLCRGWAGNIVFGLQPIFFIDLKCRWIPSFLSFCCSLEVWYIHFAAVRGVLLLLATDSVLIRIWADQAWLYSAQKPYWLRICRAWNVSVGWATLGSRRGDLQMATTAYLWSPASLLGEGVIFWWSQQLVFIIGHALISSLGVQDRWVGNWLHDHERTKSSLPLTTHRCQRLCTRDVCKLCSLPTALVGFIIRGHLQGSDLGVQIEMCSNKENSP